LVKKDPSFLKMRGLYQFLKMNMFFEADFKDFWVEKEPKNP
jgi:hypothetical protein